LIFSYFPPLIVVVVAVPKTLTGKKNQNPRHILKLASKCKVDFNPDLVFWMRIKKSKKLFWILKWLDI
jgi:hypothetical protein